MLFIGFLLGLFVFINKKWAIYRGYSVEQTRWLFALWIYHIVICLVFYRYLLFHGGDSWNYWHILSANEAGINSWSDLLGTGTSFMYWVNYPFSQIAGLGYLSGTVLYASVSFLGFLLAFDLILLSFSTFREKYAVVPAICILFLPNVHFWTAGVGKEALLWPGLLLVLVGVNQFPGRMILLFMGLLLTLMVRPLQGLVLVIAVLAVIPFHQFLYPYRKKVIPLSILFIISIFAYRFVQGSLIYGFNLNWIGDLLDWQNQYLASFGATSFINMREYNWLEKVAALFFRPYLWEVRDFWTFAAAVENAFTLGFFILASGCFFLLPKPFKLPVYLWVALGYGLLLALLFALTLNNLGIIMRMKSIYLPFFSLISLYLYFELVRKKAVK